MQEMMGSQNGQPDLGTLYIAIQTLYSEAGTVPSSEKHAASFYLEEFQKSVFAWTCADQLLYIGKDLNSRYFGAHTLRTKIQNSFHELPPEAHIPLRDSLIQHVKNINATTETSIVNQLCLAVAHMVLKTTNWADPIGHLLNSFSADTNHWWPLLEILTFIPEEVHSRKLQLGENRRNQIINQLESVAPTILEFLKQTLTSSMTGIGNSSVFPLEPVNFGILNCFKSWVPMNAEVFCSDRPGDILGFAVNMLRDRKTGSRIHSAATECLCSVIEVLPDLDSTGNNNGTDFHILENALFEALLSFEEAYHYSVAEEDQEKTQNYARIFTDYAESMIRYMLRCWRNPHYSLRVIDLLLMCETHHDYEIRAALRWLPDGNCKLAYVHKNVYDIMLVKVKADEVAEMTFGFWYRLSEDLYHAHDQPLNTMFRPYVVKFIQAMYKHCYIEPDHEGPLTPNDEFYDFRKRTAELVEDLIFVVGSLQTFHDLGAQLERPDSDWFSQEAALFLLHTVSKSVDGADTAVVEPVVARVLGWNEWRHVCLRISAVRFIGGLSAWFSKHPEEYLLKAMSFLAGSLEFPEVSNAAGAALLTMCQLCANQIAPRHVDSLLGLLKQMDGHNISNDAVIGLLRGLGHVMGNLPREKLTSTVQLICRAQLEPLSQLVQMPNVEVCTERGTKSDPTFWMDRLSALFRSTDINLKDGQEHPCQSVICSDVWPVMSLVCDRYQADARVMERLCRCLRYAVRCVGKHSHPFLAALVNQLVSMYNAHHHSCFLYLGSILVDEYGGEEQCIPGLISMLEAFFHPTFRLLAEPNGLRNNPDTVDDFFRLCARYLQRCPLHLLRSQVLTNIIQLAKQGTHLDHREANTSVVKFLYELVHQGRRAREHEELTQQRTLVFGILEQHGLTLVHSALSAVIFSLPTPLLQGICEFFYELKEFMRNEFSVWLENALKQLPNSNTSGNPYATLDQLQRYHEQILNSRGSKEMCRFGREFCRLYR